MAGHGKKESGGHGWAAAILAVCVIAACIVLAALHINDLAPEVARATRPPAPATTLRATAPPTPTAPAATPSPTPAPTPARSAAAAAQADPAREGLGFISEIKAGGEIVKAFLRVPGTALGGQYAFLEGVTTFRGNALRDAPNFGTADIVEEEIEKVWSVNIGGIDKWTGVGWNGQPALVRWPDGIRAIMNLYPAKKEKSGLIEVIYATMDGNIYFLDLDDGQPTRPAISVGFPVKGSVAVDPRGYPLLYCGQGIGENGGVQGAMGYRIFSLIDQSALYFLDGYDPFNLRYWRAFDSVPLVDGATDTLILCGENGLLYTIRLNTDFNPEKGSIKIDPEVVRYRYQTNYSSKLGIENSPAVFEHYAYFADNTGLIQCVDLNTLKPVWASYTKDDTDATVVLDLRPDGAVALYTGCEVDAQGEGGESLLRRYDAMSGEILWEKGYVCGYNGQANGGLLATPVSGKEDIEDLVIFWVARTKQSDGRGTLAALDKDTGETVWERDLNCYGWSSPVPLYTPEGRGYLVVCDANGRVYLIRGATGETVSTIELGSNVEGSAAAFGNMLVVGTRGQQIFGFCVK